MNAHETKAESLSTMSKSTYLDKIAEIHAKVEAGVMLAHSKGLKAY